MPPQACPFILTHHREEERGKGGAYSKKCVQCAANSRSRPPSLHVQPWPLLPVTPALQAQRLLTFLPHCLTLCRFLAG